MRNFSCTLALLCFAVPVLVHAAPPTVTIIISHDTIYPTATVESGVATTTVIDICFSEQVQARASIKIMSPSGIMIRSLYSSSGTVTNPKPYVWDGTNDSGALVADGIYTVLISATSNEGNGPMTDSSKTITVASSDNSDSSSDVSDATDNSSATTSTNDTATEDTTVSSSSGGPAVYLPIPTLHIVTAGNRTISSSADVAFTAAVYDGNGNKRDDALVTWSFGDGMQKTGTSVFHAYYDPGEYLAVVHASTPDGGDTRSEAVMTVEKAGIAIASVSARGITLINNDTRTLDLSLWRLSAGGQEFKIPMDTEILANHTILFPSQVIELPIAGSASLLYPSGEVAATYPATVAASETNTTLQPSAPAASYGKTQAVDPVTSTKTNIQENDEAVAAPAATTKLAAAGAALPATSSTPASSNNSRASGLFHSPWTFGLLGVITAAGGAFILL